MKRHLLVSILGLLALAPNASRVLAQGTAFTYQGRLTDGTNAASGNYDLRFSIFDVPAGGSSIAGPITNANVSISGGLFTATLDFGTGVFDGSPRWLQIGVRTNKVIDHAECYVKDGVHTNGLENFWSLLKRTLKGTHVHVAPFHLFRYLDDQTHRFNERKENDQTRFVRAMRTTKGRRLTYRKLTGTPQD